MNWQLCVLREYLCMYLCMYVDASSIVSLIIQTTTIIIIIIIINIIIRKRWSVISFSVEPFSILLYYRRIKNDRFLK